MLLCVGVNALMVNIIASVGLYIMHSLMQDQNVDKFDLIKFSFKT